MPMTQAEALTHLSERLNDEGGLSYSLPEQRRWINESARDIARQTECNRGLISVTLTAGTDSHILATQDLMKPISLSYCSIVNVLLLPTSF